MKLLNFTVIKLSLCLLIGILIGHYFSISWFWVLCSISTCIVLLSTSFFIAKKRFIKTVWFGVFTIITTVCLGVLVTHVHNQKNFSNHYTKYYYPDKDSIKPITCRVRETLKPGNFNNKYVIDILEIEDQQTSGKALLHIKKDSLLAKLKVDEIYILKEFLNPIPAPLNPGQFDYKTYLERQYIYHQIYTEKAKLFRVSENKHTFIGYASRWRDLINFKLRKYPFHEDELSIINALLLGQRQDISKEVYTSYTNAGAIHILAVSGLHVGILLLLLNQILKPIENVKHGKIIKMICILILLWVYAIIAGVSASIIRAATMFSIVAIGMHLKRPTNIYNTLFISIFFMLLAKPMFLFDVGFQLSYLAVFAIVSIQPILYILWNPKFWLLHKLWEVFTVTIAAQFGVLPIGLYYFHQFPGLFWLSNMIIIPFLGIILALGVLVIILALIDVLPTFFATFYGYIIDLMNSFFEWISHQDQFLFQGISFHYLHVIISYLLIIVIIRLYLFKSFKSIMHLLYAIICFQAVSIYLKHENSQDAFLVFHKTKHTIIGKKQNNTLKLFHNLDTTTNNYITKNFIIANHISNTTEDSIQDMYHFNKNKILIVDSLNVYNIKSVTPDFVLLRNSPKINLDRVLDSIHPKGIIADGSNYKSYMARWEATCRKRKLPFHQTSKKGAFILKE